MVSAEKPGLFLAMVIRVGLRRFDGCSQHGCYLADA